MSTFKLRGSRVLLTVPPRKDSGLHLSPEAQQEILIQELKSMNTLEVFAVGDNVTDLKVGDKVYVSPSTIMHSELITVNQEEKFLIREMDIVLIW